MCAGVFLQKEDVCDRQLGKISFVSVCAQVYCLPYTCMQSSNQMQFTWSAGGTFTILMCVSYVSFALYTRVKFMLISARFIHVYLITPHSCSVAYSVDGKHYYYSSCCYSLIPRRSDVSIKYGKLWSIL